MSAGKSRRKRGLRSWGRHGFMEDLYISAAMVDVQAAKKWRSPSPGASTMGLARSLVMGTGLTNGLKLLKVKGTTGQQRAQTVD